MSVTEPQAEVHALATLVQLGRRAREACDEAELRFIAVNETHALAPYRQAALWSKTKGVTALSGVVAPEANAPYVQWLARLIADLQDRPDEDAKAATPCLLDAYHLPEQTWREWAEWLPEFGLCLKLPALGHSFCGGVLLLARDDPWSQAEMALLSEWAMMWSQSYALKASSPSWMQTWRGLNDHAQPGPHGRGISRIFYDKRVWLTVALAALLLFPVHLTVLAPAELVPLDPAVIRAPLDGVVDRILVMPNQAVKEAQALFEFDRDNIQNRLQIALRAQDTVQAEYRQKSQQAVFDPGSKSQLAVLQGQIAEKGTEVAYLRNLAERGVVLAPRSGVVLFDAPTEWVGRLVVTGERIMVVADEHAVVIEAWLSPADAVPLRDGAKVTLYLNADPLNPVVGTLDYVGHEAILRPNGHYAYRVRANLDEGGERPRVGLKGTARLQGEQVSLGYWIVRRPLAASRAWLGW